MGLGKTVILVTHDIRAVEEYCDRSMLIDKGRILGIDKPRVISQEYMKINISDEDIRLRKELVGKNLDNPEQIIYDGNDLPPKARITSCRLYNDKGEETFVLRSGKSFQIAIQVSFTADVENVVFGVMFRNSSDGDIFGIHSLYSRNQIMIEKISRDKEYEITFEAEMILTEGIYNIYIGCASQESYSKYEILDEKENVFQVRIMNEQDIWGKTNVNSKIAITEMNG